ncbi:hypothetical protein [Streptomyces sp. RK9]|uniref:hypothetical protein n=1 Tax=Streptomyces sp. RK9 TaxID=3239284 RepID=UPI0038687016
MITMRLTGEDLGRLPGVRDQLERIGADLALGRSCLWLMPDELVAHGIAGELHRMVLDRCPERIDVPEPTTATEQPPKTFETSWPPYAAGDVPLLDGFDDGFDIGWDFPRACADAPRSPRDTGPSELMSRLAKELSVDPGRTVDELTDPVAQWRPVIGIRAWAEPGSAQGPGGREADRGQDIARLVRALGAAAKDVGLPPEKRPRVMVTSRLQDLPSLLPDELELELATSAVHWWWGTMGRLDTATLLAGLRGSLIPGPSRTSGAALRTRVLRAVREEVVGELSGPDIGLAMELLGRWDGSDRTLDESLRACLVALRRDLGSDCPAIRSGAGVQHKPPSALRQAWADGIVQSWEGRPRVHPAVWHRDGGSGRPDQLNILVSQAQARVLMPWLEDARRRLAEVALAYVNRPVKELVELHMRNRLPDYRTRPERTFRCAEPGDLLRACNEEHVRLPSEERRLLRSLVAARNALSHREALSDSALGELCERLAEADRRWVRDE